MILVHAGSWISLEFLINMLRELAQRDQRSQTLSQLLLALFIWSHCVCSALGGENYADIRLTKLDDDGFALKNVASFPSFVYIIFFEKWIEVITGKLGLKLLARHLLFCRRQPCQLFFNLSSPSYFLKYWP